MGSRRRCHERAPDDLAIASWSVMTHHEMPLFELLDGSPMPGTGTTSTR
jgi:hypothetical protein